MRKARALQAQRREEYQRARSSTSRSQEEQQQQPQPPAVAGSKQLEKKRRLEEEALQKVGATVQILQYNRGSYLFFYFYFSSVIFCLVCDRLNRKM